MRNIATPNGEVRKAIEVNMNVNLNKPEEYEVSLISNAHKMQMSNDRITSVLGRILKCLAPGHVETVKLTNNGTLTSEEMVNGTIVNVAMLISHVIRSLNLEDDSARYVVDCVSNSFRGTLTANVEQSLCDRETRELN